MHHHRDTPDAALDRGARRLEFRIRRETKLSAIRGPGGTKDEPNWVITSERVPETFVEVPKQAPKGHDLWPARREFRRRHSANLTQADGKFRTLDEPESDRFEPEPRVIAGVVHYWDAKARCWAKPAKPAPSFSGPAFRRLPPCPEGTGSKVFSIFERTQGARVAFLRADTHAAAQSHAASWAVSCGFPAASVYAKEV